MIFHKIFSVQCREDFCERRKTVYSEVDATGSRFYIVNNLHFPARLRVRSRGREKISRVRRLMLRGNYGDTIKDRARILPVEQEGLLTPDIHPLFRLINTPPLGREKRTAEKWTRRARKWRARRVCHLRIYFIEWVWTARRETPSRMNVPWLAIVWQFISRLP